MAVGQRFDGKVALVTGGASGIGAATARRLASEGAKVVLGDLNRDGAEQVAKEIGDAAFAVQFDAGDTGSIKQLVDNAAAHFGRFDVLHNNVAILSPEHASKDTNVLNIDFDTWDTTMRINLRGYLAGCKYAIPYMLEHGGGSIVMTASTQGQAGDRTQMAYAASKSGVMMLTKYVATQYGKQRIRCNAVNPGLMLTPAATEFMPAEMREVFLSNTLTPGWASRRTSRRRWRISLRTMPRS
ncbi:SDR family NAD(P)-dependent oxidoreductase [Sciscionella marina]|uniref:SDR family NAD(P)-dependent oxidoreductase n=1 Tax=Sciscionella marina TaxID=508770 RepID=UPI00039AA90E|nr:SDR family NAD(P)-dependent oxidoreductase [Sciscionella marina]